MKILEAFGVDAGKAEVSVNTAVGTDGLTGVEVLVGAARANGACVDTGPQAHKTVLSSQSVINARFIVRLPVGW